MRVILLLLVLLDDHRCHRENFCFKNDPEFYQLIDIFPSISFFELQQHFIQAKRGENAKTRSLIKNQEAG